jgi:D-alanyl-lipoteichoic acid acyltransferase DltB (MBOAT superfamily)
MGDPLQHLRPATHQLQLRLLLESRSKGHQPCGSKLYTSIIHNSSQNVANALQKKNIDPASFSERERIDTPPSPQDFSFRNYIAYVLYSPLYLAGPILTFNDYISQQRHQLPSITRNRTGLYALRFLICLLTMEIVLHFLYAVAISKSNPDWSQYTPFQLSMLGYFNLHVIWLKLLLPWRFFRLWALLDGVDPPENMVRCVSDNYSALAFWRGWHRSFNRWVTRYVYIPLGGSRGSRARAIANFFAVFTFVALWHDINLRLLVWGWLITLFVLPEILATLAFPAKKWQDRPEMHRVLCGIGAVGNILMMMAANLVGFAVGVDGLKGLVEGIIDSWGGRLFLLGACATLFVGAQVMFEWREGEKRRGVNLKC